MKHVLCTLCLLLPTVGWASEFSLGVICPGSMKAGEQCFQVDQLLACRSQMEAAMRAMEPFVSTPRERYSIGLDDLVVHLDTQQDALRKEIARLDQRDRAWSLWVTVKNTCWVKP